MARDLGVGSQWAGVGWAVLGPCGCRICTCDDMAEEIPSKTPKRLFWVAVKELKLSYYIGETPLFTIYIYTHYGKPKP